jgi:prevent-host-death family protein
MAKEYSLYEAKARFSELVRRVRERGDTVVVTYHGEPVAEIRPISRPNQATLPARVQRLTEQGILVPAAEARQRLRRVTRKPGALDRFLQERDG